LFGSQSQASSSQRQASANEPGEPRGSIPRPHDRSRGQFLAH
jgi:hypothetical protein